MTIIKKKNTSMTAISSVILVGTIPVKYRQIRKRLFIAKARFLSLDVY